MRSFIAVLYALVAVAGFCASAFAVEVGHNYPGLNCKPGEHFGPQDDSGVFVDSFGTLGNAGEADVWIFCPVVRQTSATTIEYARIIVTHLGGASVVGRGTCDLVGGGSVAQPNNIQQLAGGWKLEYALGDVNVYDESLEEDDFLFFRCVLVPNGHIVSYYVVENLGED